MADAKHEAPNDNFVIEHFPVGGYACTCTIIGDKQTGEAIVVDGGADVATINKRLTHHGLRATRLLHTHAHHDHIGGTAELRAQTGARAAIHAGDLPLAAMLDRQAAMLGLPPVEIPTFDDLFEDGDRVALGSGSIDILHTPGHTPGSSCFALSFLSRPIILSGDTLFAGSIGRSDLGGTCAEDIIASIRTKLYQFDDDAVVVPGHGRFTTIGRERMSNPFLVEH